MELRAWAARNRHDMDAAIRLGTAGAAVATDHATKASCLVAVAFAHRGRGELQATARLLAEAAELRPPAALGLAAWTGVLQVHQGRPLDALNHLEPLLGADADRGLQAFWVEHTLQMTAHAYGLIGRPAEALTVLERLAHEIDQRGTVVRYAGVIETYRSWILRNLGAAGATDLARAGLDRAGSVEIRAPCFLDIADGLMRDGDVAEAAAHLDQADSAARARWFHNQWRFESRLGILRARVALAAGEAEVAADHATRVHTAAAARGDRRYRTIGGVLQATALARAGVSYDVDDVRRQLALLPEVAALESWWLAAELAAATSSAAQASAFRALAITWVDRLVLDAGEHGDTLRGAARRKLT